MKKVYFLFSLIFLLSITIKANGVGVIDASRGIYLKLLSSKVSVDVENQVAVVKTTQVFQNQTDTTQFFKYAFPLDEQASAIGLRWFVNGEWHEAKISAQPQDTTLPGGGGIINSQLQAYLGKTPLYFDPKQALEKDSSITIELTYVEFLKYEFGNVSFTYPENYSLIQTAPIDSEEFSFTLTSSRTITSIQMLNHSSSSMTNSSKEAVLQYSAENVPADKDYSVIYSLSLNELGLFSFSTSQPDSLVPDSLGKGYFVFVAEPDPSQNTDIINKVFTLIIDRSGSMTGTKITQAKDAADYIVNNLNPGDKFNIVDFATNVTSFRTSHVDYNTQNRDDALAYISSLEANGNTNISGAFDTAVPQFAVANDSTANIIIFLTDGLATAGITETESLLSHINDLIKTTEKNIIVFTFGVGNDVDKQLLSLLASDNEGISQFLGDNQVESVITNFYAQIRNPVLLNTKISFTPQILSEIYPDPLPNLYKGQQMIVAGRYSGGDSANITLSGEAFGKPVSYDYVLNLSDSLVKKNQFLPKVWAKQKIEHLLVQYYNLDPSSEQAQTLKNIITNISVEYGIITDFTSYTSGTTGIKESQSTQNNKNLPGTFKLLGNYPNPFNPSTVIKFYVGKDINNSVKIRIFNLVGQLVRTLTISVHGKGIYEVTWDGRLQNGNEAPSDVYVYVVDFGNTVLSGKMVLMK